MVKQKKAAPAAAKPAKEKEKLLVDVKREPIFDKAEAFLDLRDKIEQDQVDLAAKGQALVDMMIAQQRAKITIGGRSLTCKYIKESVKTQVKNEG